MAFCEQRLGRAGERHRTQDGREGCGAWMEYVGDARLYQYYNQQPQAPKHNIHAISATEQIQKPQSTCLSHLTAPFHNRTTNCSFKPTVQTKPDQTNHGEERRRVQISFPPSLSFIEEERKGGRVREQNRPQGKGKSQSTK